TFNGGHMMVVNEARTVTVNGTRNVSSSANISVVAAAQMSFVSGDSGGHSSHEFQREPSSYGLRRPMSHTSRHRDDAPTESTFNSLKIRSYNPGLCKAKIRKKPHPRPTLL
ncbi:MAG: hypothetical protein LBV73_18870, partial [Paraburkholderia sp.]|nr:hypothetical protein [Paraburkholderia sp.]